MANSRSLGVPQWAAPAEWLYGEINPNLPDYPGLVVPRTGLYVTNQGMLDALVAYSDTAQHPLVFLTLPPMGFSDPRVQDPNAYYPTPALLAEMVSNVTSGPQTSAAAAQAAAAQAAASAQTAHDISNISTSDGVVTNLVNDATPSQTRAALDAQYMRIGSNAQALTDANNATANGWFKASNTATNTPFPDFWLIYSIVYDVNAARQNAFLAVQSATAEYYARVKINGTWGAWEKQHAAEADLDARYMNVGEAVTDAQLPARIGPLAQVLADANNATDNGWYYFTNTTVNAPPDGSGNYFLAFVEAIGGWIVQTAHAFGLEDQNDSHLWRRRKVDSGAWGPWYRLRVAEAELDTRYVQRKGGGQDSIAALPATSGTVALDVSTANYFYSNANISGDVTPSFSNVPNNVLVTVTVEYQMGATPYVINLPTGGRWFGPAPTNAASRATLVTYQTRNGGTVWNCSATVQST